MGLEVVVPPSEPYYKDARAPPSAPDSETDLRIV